MMKAVNEAISQRLKQIRQAFMGIVTLGGQTIQVQGLNGELLSETAVIQHVGFASRLPKGCRVVVLPMMGKTNRAVVIASDKATVSVVVEEGEICIYDQFGHTVWLKEDGIHITGKTFVDGDVEVTGKITASGDIESGGDVSDQKGSIEVMRQIFNEHLGHFTPLNKKPDIPME
jgi:phage gp45-like